MDKAEAENQIAEIVFKYRLKGGMTENRIARIIIEEVLDEYAQQVSRETAVDFYISHVNNPTDRIYISKKFDTWIKNQQ